MKTLLIPIALLTGICISAQTVKDTVPAKEQAIEAVKMTYKKATVESKADRTVFNVANSAIVAGNTTWDILRMTPLLSIDNNDAVRAEGESVTVYINDRKSVFTGKELKEYLKTIPADNLLKVEVITSPSARYEASGAVVNIVLKKREDEGMKGSLTLNNRQNTKNSQYSNINLNYHKKNFTQTFGASYGDNYSVNRNSNIYNFYEDQSVREINSRSTSRWRNPSVSSTSEYELNSKNTVGIVLEYFQSKSSTESEAVGSTTVNSVFDNAFTQDQNANGSSRNLGANVFYKYYDKEKNRILDVNIGSNYFGQKNDDLFIRQNVLKNGTTPLDQIGVANDGNNRNYFLKIDYTQPVGKAGDTFEAGGKIDINNNAVANQLYGNKLTGLSPYDVFHYEDQISALYANYSKKFLDKVDVRLGLRYEYIDFTVRQDISGRSRQDAYGTFLPNILVKYSISKNYDLTATYNKSLWRPYYAEFNPFMVPGSQGIYNRGNLLLEPNPTDRFSLKLGLYKKYFISARYFYSDQDYWTDYLPETITGSDGLPQKITVSQESNFRGKSHRYFVSANTNQTFLNNQFTVNLGMTYNYIDNSDFNQKNNLKANNYLNFLSVNANLSYTNLFEKNINLNAWVEVANQNNGNSTTNRPNVFHTISATKIFPKTQMEFSLQLSNIFQRPNYNATTYTQSGFVQSMSKWDWYGFSLSFVKRFGNQKVKENTKTDVEKSGGGEK
ncbi:TonB-dependent receptor [Chryseobacterium sp. Leaf180]|uniref:outer membrane beta-barrel family protein n=1 Tax=Chryseobacterium sp. Leaf180 TaxID=1736289 RepID=UPI0006F86E17|nr:outer membrane beta-barrel family protein [Chryseobacterium sp. Leaf180]KQR90852.1 TonB-dependent receptor [Chryseobacterium sp. Leaf180]